jgi:hypothetical protein
MVMITKPIKITLTAGQAEVLRVMVVEMITQPVRKDDNNTLARYVMAEWYRHNAARFVFMPERLRLTFTPAQAYALYTLLLAYNFDCEAARVLARCVVGLIEPKI